MKLGEENIEIAIQHWDYLGDQKWEEVRGLLLDDFEAFWPQSKEKMDADGFIEINRNYPGTHKIQVLNHTHEYDNWEHRSKVITLKNEIGKRSFENIDDARKHIFEYIECWYNTKRLHSSLGYMSPVEYEEQYRHAA